MLLVAFRSLSDIVTTNIAHWERTWGMAKVDLAKRYSGSALGIVWAIARPSIFIVVYWFAIAVGLRGSSLVESVPYIFWLLPGIMAWFFISDAINVAGTSIRRNAHFVTRMVYPVSTIPTFTVLSLFFVHLMMMGVTVAIFLISGQGLDIYFLQLVYYMACTLLFAFVLATFLSTLTVVSNDVAHMVRSIMTMLFWLTPVIWPLERLDAPLKYFIMLNPITYLVQGYRNAFVLEHWFFQQWEYTLYFWTVLFVLALLSSYLFGKLRPEFADVM